MDNFLKVRNEINNYVEEMMNNNDKLFVVNVSKDKLYDIYLDSFPEVTNPVFKERRYYDCQTCKSYIKHFGNVVAIVPVTVDGVCTGYNVQSVWDMETDDEIIYILRYQPFGIPV